MDSDDERRLAAALRGELHRVDRETLGAIADALEQGEYRLGGDDGWGSRDDGEGCLLSVAAWRLGLSGGEALLARSIAAVRIPSLFDDLWAAVVARTGNPAHARALIHRLVATALVERAEDAAAAETDAAEEAAAQPAVAGSSQA